MNVVDIDLLETCIVSHNPDYFIHAGALTRPMVIHENRPDESIRNNIIGTANVALMCMKYKVKLIEILDK